MTVSNPAAVEEDELTDETRKQVQLEQSERLTMQGHVSKLLGMRRNRVAEAWGQEKPEKLDDDVQILARDIIENKHYHNAPVTAAPPAKTEAPAVTAPKASKWPWVLATMLGLAIPSTTGIVMLPEIIRSCYPPKVEQPAPTKPTEYVPILIPGKPGGAT